MEDYRWILITLIAYILSVIYDLLKRDKNSLGSPTKFSPIFYLKDNYQRIILSLMFSMLLAVLFWMLKPQLFNMDSELATWGIIVYAIIGAAPDMVIAYAKRKTSFLRPDTVEMKDEIYKRKND